MKICKVPECGKVCFMKSQLCTMHRTRLSRYKSVFLPSENKTQAESDAIHPYLSQEERHKNAKGKICCISNCETKLYTHGTVCAKHRWRLKKFGSYDLPGYQGEPSVPIRETIPEGFVHKCKKKHGFLTLDQTYQQSNREGRKPQLHCKLCARDGNIKRNYKGMESLEDYQRMWDKQKGLCAICNKPSTQKSNNKKGAIKPLSIDHDHKTNKVRELLCGFCNALLGYADDSIDILIKCITYLNKHGVT